MLLPNSPGQSIDPLAFFIGYVAIFAAIFGLYLNSKQKTLIAVIHFLLTICILYVSWANVNPPIPAIVAVLSLGLLICMVLDILGIWEKYLPFVPEKLKFFNTITGRRILIGLFVGLVVIVLFIWRWVIPLNVMGRVCDVAQRTGQPMTLIDSTGRSQSATIDPDGRFAFTAVPEGQFTIPFEGLRYIYTLSHSERLLNENMDIGQLCPPPSPTPSHTSTPPPVPTPSATAPLPTGTATLAPSLTPALSSVARCPMSDDTLGLAAIKLNTLSSGTAATPPLNLDMMIGSETESWLKDETDKFNSLNYVVDGRRIVINPIAIGSVEAAGLIRSGKTSAAIWIPASRMSIPSNITSFLQMGPSVACSPVVIAVWQKEAQTRGWITSPPSWAELADTIDADPNFLFGHTHPGYSNSGLSTILALAYAASKETGTLTEADVSQPAVAALIRKMEIGIIHYGDSTGFFADTLSQRGAAYLSAAVLYENLVFAQPSDTPGGPLLAVYPRGGTFWSDHPYTILNGSDEDRQQAAKIFGAFLLQPHEQMVAVGHGFRSPLGSAVSDQEMRTIFGTPPNFAIDLSRPTQDEIFSPPGDQVTARVIDVWKENKKNVSLVFLLDTSASMGQNGAPINQARDAMRNFVTGLGAEDEVNVIKFDTDAKTLDPKVLQPTRLDLKVDDVDWRKTLIDEIDQVPTGGGTRLINTVMEQYNQLSDYNARTSIRVMIVLTDGEDTDTTLLDKDTVKRQFVNTLNKLCSKGSCIKIYTIAYKNAADKPWLKAIANASGGREYDGTPDNINDVIKQIAVFFGPN